MTDDVVLRSLADMTLANAERLAFDHANVEIGDEAVAIKYGKHRTVASSFSVPPPPPGMAVA